MGCPWRPNISHTAPVTNSTKSERSQPVPAPLPTLQRVAELQASIAPDLYTPDVFVPWDAIESAMTRYEPSIDALQAMVDNSNREVDMLAEWLTLTASLWVVRALFAAPQPVGFADGRQLPDVAPTTQVQRQQLARLLVDLGLWRLLPAGCRVADVVRVSELSLDARRRGFRRRDMVQGQLASLVDKALADVALRLGASVHRLPSAKWPEIARGWATVVVGVDGLPVAALVNVFQAQSGGRQQRDLLETYPALQRDLDQVPMSLILVLDGQGVRTVSRRVLAQLIERVGGCMSGAEAQAGRLSDAIASAVETRGNRSGQRPGLGALISSALRSSVAVQVEDFPDSRERVLLAFGDYVASHPEQDLLVDVKEGRLGWRRTERVALTQKLRVKYDGAQAIEVVGQLLALKDLTWLPKTDPVDGAFGSLEDVVLPSKFFVAAIRNRDAVDEGVLRTVGRLNRQRGGGGSIALLLLPGEEPSPALSTTQQQAMATSVVAVNMRELDEIATSRSPRNALVRMVLTQADLTKTNPFTVMGATGGAMFYGRGTEASLLQHTLTTNSAALIGGRRIGKTSLLKYAQQRLLDAGANVWYADCQAAGNWRAFAQHASHKWGVDLTHDFSVGAVVTLFQQLAAQNAGPLIVMLDEVDNLLRWDRDASQHGGMSEPLFRALRGLSQEGSAQFVFSGERLIASVIWDPTSPHWNFCRAIPVRQLARDDADALLTSPLESLGVELADPLTALDLAWNGTSGHPQIVQQLGEGLVMALNSRTPEQRAVLTPGDVAAVIQSPGFLRHYVLTYWGQSTPFEKLTTTLLVDGADTVDKLAARLSDAQVVCDLEGIQAALRMLELYGIIDLNEPTMTWRAAYFPDALEVLGGQQLVREDALRSVRQA